MCSLLPQPNTLEKIAFLYGLNKLFTSKKSLMGKSFSIDRQLKYLHTGRTIEPSTTSYDLMNIYFLNRSMHQANEACNKLWATVELHYQVKSKERLCKRFNEGFLPSSTVPTLHYANMSALLSILSLFGLCSIVQRKKRMRFYNVVRTGVGVIMMERNSYLRKVFGKTKNGWHAQILQTYEGLLQKGLRLAKVDIEGCKQLLRERSKFHYDILGQTTMKDIYGIDIYFQLLPIVVTSINAAIKSLHQIVEPIPNGCDLRFEELYNKIQSIMESYDLKE